MKQIKQILWATAIIAIAAACDNDVDDVKPTISIVSPTDEQGFVPGDTIWFEATFTDDVELKSYKIEIHDDFDGHDHKSSVLGAWHYDGSWDFEKAQKTVNLKHGHIVIPTEVDGQPIAEGDYHFGVYCADAAGNETQVFILVEIGEHTTQNRI